MVKRIAQVSLAVLMVLALASMAAAADNVASTSNKGSLLVFPLVKNTADVTTYFFIANDNTQDIWVKCYWMNADQEIEDFHFRLTMNQPIVFSSADNDYGPPFDYPASGSLVCWATNAGDTTQTPWNHLYGTAMLSSAAADVIYNAYAFRADPNGVAAGDTLFLTGTKTALPEYDACPRYLLANFIPDNATLEEKVYHPAIAVFPCINDFRQDREATVTKLKFDIWNHYEVKFTGAWQCIKCFYEGYLWKSPSSNTGSSFPQYFGAEKFGTNVLKTPVARVRIQSASTVNCKNWPPSPLPARTPANVGLIGLLLYSNTQPAPAIAGFVPHSGHTMTGAGLLTNGEIKYDQGGSVDEAGNR